MRWPNGARCARSAAAATARRPQRRARLSAASGPAAGGIERDERAVGQRAREPSPERPRPARLASAARMTIPWHTTSAGSAPCSTSSSAAPTRTSCSAKDSPPGNAKPGSPAANASKRSGASRAHLGEAEVGPVAGVGLHQARVLAWAPGRPPRDDIGRFARRAAAGCTTARESRSAAARSASSAACARPVSSSGTGCWPWKRPSRL